MSPAEEGEFLSPCFCCWLSADSGRCLHKLLKSGRSGVPPPPLSFLPSSLNRESRPLWKTYPHSVDECVKQAMKIDQRGRHAGWLMPPALPPTHQVTHCCSYCPRGLDLSKLSCSSWIKAGTSYNCLGAHSLSIECVLFSKSPGPALQQCLKQ